MTEVNMTLKDKVVIITGGTGALGRAVVSAFLNEGAKVACTYIVDEELKGVSHFIESYKSQIKFIKANVTKEDEVKKTIQETLEGFGEIDILVNIVGGFAYAKVIERNEPKCD